MLNEGTRCQKSNSLTVAFNSSSLFLTTSHLLSKLRFAFAASSISNEAISSRVFLISFSIFLTRRFSRKLAIVDPLSLISLSIFAMIFLTSSIFSFSPCISESVSSILPLQDSSSRSRRSLIYLGSQTRSGKDVDYGPPLPFDILVDLIQFVNDDIKLLGHILCLHNSGV